MLTHIIWDSFTHISGLMVSILPLLSYKIHMFDLAIPVFKILQHGSTLFGLCTLLIYVMYISKIHPETSFTAKPKRQVLFWIAISIIGGVIMASWYAINFVSIFNYGTTVVRLFDSMILSVVLVCTFIKYVNPVD